MADFKQLILDRLRHSLSGQVWTPVDFLDLGNRDAVDKALSASRRPASYGGLTAAYTTYPASTR